MKIPRDADDALSDAEARRIRRALAKDLADEGLKICTKCGEVKPSDEFHYNGNGKWRPDCRTCKNAQQLARHYAHRTHLNKARSKRYKANRAKALASFRAHYEQNKRSYLERNRRWVAANALAARAQWNRRRERERNATGTCSAEQYQARWDFYRGLCWLCGAEATEMDHVIPLAVRPIGWPANLRPICRHCNAVKSDSPPGTTNPA